MTHTFLLQEGLWKAKGTYYNEQNNQIPVVGETRIIHAKDKWLNEGFLKLLLSSSPVEYQNKYEIIPLESERDFTTWESFNPALGNLHGKFMIVNDTIISMYVSDNGEYTGSECLIQVSETTYKNRGFAFKGNKKLSSWAVELTKIK